MGPGIGGKGAIWGSGREMPGVEGERQGKLGLWELMGQERRPAHGLLSSDGKTIELKTEVVKSSRVADPNTKVQRGSRPKGAS